jgi:hypothetical protein
MRRWISTLLAALMLANIAAWPAGVLAEVLEHEQEIAQFDTQPPPVEPLPAHCQHGCAGHYGQHFQGQVAAFPFKPRVAVSASIVATPEFFPPQHISTLPFRPPLSAPILS